MVYLIHINGLLKMKKIIKIFLDKYFAKLSVFLRVLRDEKALNGSIVNNPLGFKFIGHSGMETGEFEKNEVFLVEKLLKDRDLLVNVGANIGYYCCIALNKGKEVIAFEPIDTNLKNLYKNIEINHWQKDITVFPIALAEKTGLINIYGAGTGTSLIAGWAGGSINLKRTVPVNTLDNTVLEQIKIKKTLFIIDVEGVEFQTLLGAKECIALNQKPIWIVEIGNQHHKHKNIKELFSLFFDNGYKAYIADKYCQEVSFEILEQLGNGEVLSVYNFLFIDEKSHV